MQLKINWDYKNLLTQEQQQNGINDNNKNKQRNNDNPVITIFINDEVSRYGHHLTYRLSDHILVMENIEENCFYELSENKQITGTYKFIVKPFLNHHVRKQKKEKVISDTLNWKDLKWSQKGVRINGKLYPIHKINMYKLPDL